MTTIGRRAGASLALCLLAVSAAAQTTTGRITGTITDPAGARVPGARIEVSNLATGIRVEGRSNEAGIYLLNFVDPGRYQLTAEAPGFRRYVRTPVVVETGMAVSLDISLELDRKSVV